MLNGLGHNKALLNEEATRCGAVETVAEGTVYAKFLAENAGKFAGVILCLPNFGDETGAAAGLQSAGVSRAHPGVPRRARQDAPACRRDAFCGKFSVMDAFCQCGVRFTALQPHTVHPKSGRFAANIDCFDRLCRVVKAMKGMVVGAIGARTTAVKTVRIDELALQKRGIAVETLDLSHIFARMNVLSGSDDKVRAKSAPRGLGCNQGRIAPTPMTFGSLLTEACKLKFYLGQGRIAAEPIAEDFFGCAEIEGVQSGLRTVGNSGHRDHVSVTPGHVAHPVREAFEKYLGYEVTAV